MASTKFTQFGQASNTSETEISVGVKGGSNFKRLNNMTATTAPTSTDDGSDGYTVGSTWFDTTTGTLYVCSDSTNGAAVWVAQKESSGTYTPTISGVTNDAVVSISNCFYVKAGKWGNLSFVLNVQMDGAYSATNFDVSLPFLTDNVSILSCAPQSIVLDYIISTSGESSVNLLIQSINAGDNIEKLEVSINFLLK